MVSRFLLLIAALALAGQLFADVVTYTYDDAGRLTSVTYPNGASISYTYDAAGNLTARTVTAATSAKKPDPKAKPVSDAKTGKSEQSEKSSDKAKADK